MKIIVNKNNFGYYIDFFENNEACSDSDAYICSKLKINLFKYREKGIQYGGFLTRNDELYFNKEKDAKKYYNEYVIPSSVIKQLEG
ncbi:MAG: hypothetical protein ACOCP8_01950 [archaeon]